jgi:hypothetical protein
VGKIDVTEGASSAKLEAELGRGVSGPTGATGRAAWSRPVRVKVGVLSRFSFPIVVARHENRLFYRGRGCQLLVSALLILSTFAGLGGSNLGPSLAHGSNQAAITGSAAAGQPAAQPATSQTLN